MAEPIRVLTVEDDRATCALLRAFLELTEGRVICGEAHDGWEGLELVHALQPDLVLLDLVMPGLDGLGFLQALADNPPAVRPKIIVLSGVCSDGYVQRACRLGVSYYMVKPVKLTELALRIEALFAVPAEPDEEVTAYLLQAMGANKDCLGFRFACYGAGLFPGGEAPPQLKEIYLRIAKRFSTSYSCVEKNLRTTVRQVHGGDTPLYRKRMGFSLQEKPPDNGTFLRRLAELVKPNTAHKTEAPS